MKTYNFFVEGMHCKSCVVLTEGELNNLPQVEKAVSDLKTCCVEVTGDFEDKSIQEVADELSIVLQKHGYKLKIEEERKKINWSDFVFAVPIAFTFILLFIILQNLGIVNFASADSLGYGTAFIVGLVASISTCMAVVGGLVLSLSATFARSEKKFIYHGSFHLARLITFFVLGGAIGALGAVFQLGIWGNFAMTLLVGVVMLVMGINLLEIWKPSSRFIPSLPKSLAKPLLAIKNNEGPFMPVMLGIATFFLPCGFTQAMQIYTLSAGSFSKGALIMFIFALGTLPVLAFLSITSHKIGKSPKSGIFFKTAGIIVLFFAIINFLNSLATIGLIALVLNF